jgi:hypothetical protein
MADQLMACVGGPTSWKKVELPFPFERGVIGGLCVLDAARHVVNFPVD